MNPNFKNITANFVQYCIKELNIQQRPSIKLIADKNWVAEYRSFGEYNPGAKTIKVYYVSRNTADVLRSLAHELVHHRQEELGMIEAMSGDTGSEIENEANAMAGILLRDYGKQNIQIYDLDSTSINEAIKINLYPGKKGVDVDFVNKDIKDAPKVQIPLDKLFRNEPAKKMKTPESIESIKNLIVGYKKGKKIDPILVRKKGERFQILDGHHRFTAAKLAGLKDINAIIVPEENITPVDGDGNLLKEAKQIGTLYHFTSYKNMIKIIEDNLMLKSPTPDGYISFTRNKTMVSDTISQSVRMTIDGNKLSEKYSIGPHADTKAGYGRKAAAKPGARFTGDESEERISTQKYPNGIDISNALVVIDLMKITKSFDPDNPEDFEDFVEPPSLESYNELIILLKREAIPYKIVEGYK